MFYKRKVKKKKSKAISKKDGLETKLDNIFSIYIRLRDADEYGYCTCISCGKILHWSEMDNGHYIGREKNNTRYSEINCNPQCRSCNRFSEGNKGEYKENLIKKHGKDKVDLLKLRSIQKIGVGDYNILIELYYKKARKIAYEKCQYDFFLDRSTKYLGKKYVEEQNRFFDTKET